MASGYCTGKDRDNVDFASIASESDCENYALEKDIEFMSTNPVCDDDPGLANAKQVCTQERCSIARDDVCKDRDPLILEVPAESGNFMSVLKACKLSCSFCGYENRTDPQRCKRIENHTPAPSGCMLEGEGDAKIIRFYNAEATRRFTGITYLPICEVFRCNGTYEEVVTPAGLRSLPVCKNDQKFAKTMLDQETESYNKFYIIVGSSLFILVVCVYSVREECCCRNSDINCHNCFDKCCGTCSCATTHYTSGCTRHMPKFVSSDMWKVHRMVWFGIVARLGDMATDWAFLLINIEGDLFKDQKEDLLVDPEVYTRAAFIICIVGTVLTPLDILSKVPSLRREAETEDKSFCFRFGGGGDDGMGGQKDGLGLWCCRLGRRASPMIGLLVILCEDMPQLIVTGIFAEHVTFGAAEGVTFSKENAANLSLTVLNFVISFGSLCYNLHLVYSGLNMWKSEKQLEKWYAMKAQMLTRRTKGDQKNHMIVATYKRALDHKHTVLTRQAKRQGSETEATRVKQLQKDIENVKKGTRSEVTKMEMYEKEFPLKITPPMVTGLRRERTPLAEDETGTNPRHRVPRTRSGPIHQRVRRQSSFVEPPPEMNETSFPTVRPGDSNGECIHLNDNNNVFKPVLDVLKKAAEKAPHADRVQMRTKRREKTQEIDVLKLNWKELQEQVDDKHLDPDMLAVCFEERTCRETIDVSKLKWKELKKQVDGKHLSPVMIAACREEMTRRKTNKAAKKKLQLGGGHIHDDGTRPRAGTYNGFEDGPAPTSDARPRAGTDTGFTSNDDRQPVRRSSSLIII
jgi:hypothetical protein